jgi:hypothetical protein
MKELIKKNLIKPIAILIVRYVQYRYKKISLLKSYNSSNINKLILLQAIEEYFKKEFQAWGFFHRSCVVNSSYHNYIKRIFPDKNFEENDIVICHKYDAITFYKNMIYNLNGGAAINYKSAILNQLKKWDKEEDKLYYLEPNTKKNEQNRQMKYNLKRNIGKPNNKKTKIEKNYKVNGGR